MAKAASEIKEKVKHKLKEEKILIFGYGEPAKRFAERWGCELNVAGFVTDYPQHPGQIEACGKVYPLLDFKQVRRGEYFLVLAPRLRYLADNLLSTMNWEPFEEYIWDNWIEIFLRGKKYLFIAGICQVATLYYYLSAMKTVTDEYVVSAQFTHLMRSKNSQKYWRYVAQLCDVYLCGKHEGADMKFFDDDELAADCMKITIPRFFSRLYWPQAQVGTEALFNDYFMKAGAYVETQPHGPFETGDANINRLLEEGKNADEIVRILSSEDFYSPAQMKRHYENEMAALRQADEGCDICFSEYFTAHWKEHMVYRDPVHLSVNMNWWLAEQVLRRLGLGTEEIEAQRESPATEALRRFRHHCTEIPVYPSVAKHLGLAGMATDETRYDVTFYHGMERLTFEEYVRRYVEICGAVKSLKDMW